MLANLHLLRALAALGVVYYHATSEAGLNLPYAVGRHGVDVFFVLSGFIISYIGASHPEGFLRRRLIRVVPFYWSATLALYLLVRFLPGLLHTTRADVPQLVASLLFIPRETSYAGLVPTLVLGWSLNYEMYFYVLFALALRVSREGAPVLCVLAISLVFTAIHLSGTTHSTVRFYASPLVFEFALGIAAYYLFLVVSHYADEMRLTVSWWVWVLAVGSLVTLVVEEYHQGFGLPRVLVAGLPAFLLLSSALVLERVYDVRATSRAVYLLGESSYILYLVHPYVIYGILRVGLNGRTDFPPVVLGLLVLGLLAASAGVAVGLHLCFERPILTYLRRERVTTADSLPRESAA